MSKFWITLVIIVLVLGALLAITYFVPEVKSFAGDLASKNNLPLWIVGLFAPIAYLFRSFGSKLSALLGPGQSESTIRKENDDIKAQLARIRDDMARNDEWRRREIDVQVREIDLLKAHVQELQAEDKTLADRYAAVQQLTPEQAFHQGGFTPLDTLGGQRVEGVPVD